MKRKKNLKKPGFHLSLSTPPHLSKLLLKSIFALLFPLLIYQFPACSQGSGTGVITSRQRALFDHSTIGSATCASCHSADVPTGIIHEMNHSYSGLPDCKQCHSTGIGVAWIEGNYVHSPSPPTCQECHSAQRPKTPVGSDPFDHTTQGTGDCFPCHKNPGISWSGGNFYNHSPTPTSCTTCHNADRPTVANYPDSAGTVSGHYGTTDCYSCHLPQSLLITRLQFSHVNAASAQVTTCLPCHLSIGQKQHGSSIGDCVQCHTPNQW